VGTSATDGAQPAAGAGPGDDLVERDDELAALDAAIAGASSGAGRIVTIEGPPGIGKTRLVSAAVGRAAAAGFAVRRAGCSLLERGLAFGVAGQLLPEALADRTGDPVDAGDWALLHELRSAALALADARPVLVAVDDAQWADPPSLRLLAQLARRVGDAPVLLLLAHRPAAAPAAGHAVPQLLATVEHTALTLRPLSDAGSETLLRDALGAETPSGFCAAASRAAGGNPLLLRELARAITARRLAPTADAVDALLEGGAAGVARTVRTRLAELNPAATALAEAAAIVGDGQPLRVAADVAGLRGEVARDAAAALRDVEVLAPGETVAFTHPLVRAALRGDLRALVPGDAHARAAELLARAGAPDRAVAEALLGAPPAGDPARVATLRRAAAAALAAHAPGAARRWTRRALAEPPPEADRAAVLLELADAESSLDQTAAEAALDQALALLRDPVARATALGRAAAFRPSGEPDEAIALGLQGVRELGDASPPLRRRLLGVVGTAVAVRGPATGPAELVAALRDLGDADDPGARMLCCVAAYRDAWTNASATRVLASGERAFGGDWLTALDVEGGPFAIGFIALLAADAPGAARLAEEWVAHGRRRNHVAHIAGALMLRARVRLQAGALAAAVEDAEASLDAFEAYGVRGAAPAFAASTLAAAQLELGDVEAAARALAHVDPADEAGTPGLIGMTPVRAAMRAASGEAAGALHDTSALGARFEALGGRCPALLPWRSQAALAAHGLGDDGARPRGLAEAEVAAARAWGTPRAIGRALTALGVVTPGAAGVATLREAVEVLDGAPAPLEHARAQLALGGALHDAGDAAGAREPLRRALEIADQCGAAPLAGQARTALVATGARPRRAALTGPGALTAAERRVAEAAASGASNREIAEELYLTPSTVRIHLSRSLRKLGVSSRGELADALRNGRAP
jgi:DNA-binding CsgD family transcriptional regulator/RecA/RadA recombinase